jgi:two-component system OmpR family sensor kinase
VLAVACLGVMIASPAWETIPFHVIWITLTLLYGFRVWSLPTTAAILGAVMIGTGASIFADAFDGIQLWGELFEVPLMAAMFLAMVWHARRRVQALETVQALAEERASLLEQQERLLQNVSHELRTPVTIARGHLELLQRSFDTDRPELTVAFEELQRIEHIVDRVLLLARVERTDWLSRSPFELVPFLEDVFMRWSEVARRAWHLGEIAEVTLDADETWVRASVCLNRSRGRALPQVPPADDFARWSGRRRSCGRSRTRSSRARCARRISSPARAGPARPRWRGSSPRASTARTARRPARTTPATRASRSPTAPRST